jgi:hypothetical protein
MKKILISIAEKGGFAINDTENQVQAFSTRAELLAAFETALDVAAAPVPSDLNVAPAVAANTQTSAAEQPQTAAVQ